MTGATDVNSTLQGIVTNIANEVKAVQALGTAVVNIGTTLIANNTSLVVAVNAVASAVLNTFPQVRGTFTLANATLTVVGQVGIKTGGEPVWTPTNATAALTQRTQGLYLATVTAGVSFTVSTQTGVAAGTETFFYFVSNP